VVVAPGAGVERQRRALKGGTVGSAVAGVRAGGDRRLAPALALTSLRSVKLTRRHGRAVRQRPYRDLLGIVMDVDLE
jgi:hypothetical protein